MGEFYLIKNYSDQKLKLFLYDSNNTSTTISDLQKIAKYNNFDFENQYVEYSDYSDIISDISNNNSLNMDSTDVAIISNGDSLYSQIVVSTDETTSSITDLDTTGRFAVFVQHSSNVIKLGEKKLQVLKTNTNTSENQNTALKYIFSFLMIISLYAIGTNLDKVKITHIVIYLCFVLYAFFYNTFSTYLLDYFRKTFAYTSKSSSSTLILTYVKLISITALILLFPILIFLSFSADLSFITDSTNISVEDTFNDSKNIANDAFNDITENANNIANDISSSADSLRENINEGLESTTQAIKDTTDNIESPI